MESTVEAEERKLNLEIILKSRIVNLCVTTSSAEIHSIIFSRNKLLQQAILFCHIKTE